VGAEAEYRTALVLDPKHVSAHIFLRVPLADKDDTAGADAEYRTALAFDPKHDDALYFTFTFGI
jgi:hypothetical protein